ncbi:nodulation protein NolO [Candidatus Pelagibacter sp. HTCC7211]|uniref:carbamoyltransferase family protein n=1 Tax=Pelagibacter sp. (strain HTCC7211) TaxID=439493 RepID=UPI000183AC88|nr:carbamoyltransferase [Candidatus Pelagibacter sp. HTCC7211]EDZ60480.1 nodulation protein NolO [Candidatus Pelagibacter sp. HTCC7211]
MKSILGISAFYHDSAASILIDGKIIAAAQEERFTRKKHDSSYPYHAIEFVLSFAKIKLSEVDQIIFFEKPFLKFERLLETYVAFAPKGFKSFSTAMPIWLKDKLFQKKLLFTKLKKHDDKFNDNKKIYFSEHHLSHAASAFFPSPFEEAIVLTADGVGEWATTTVAIGKGNSLEIKKEIHFPHSLGLLYSAFTYYTGFKVNSGEYKLMGLAPYGDPIYEQVIKRNIIDIKEDGSFHLDQSYFNYATGLTMTNEKFNNLFGRKARNPRYEELTQFHMDIASSIQKITEDIMIKLCKSLKNEFNISNLCLAGGVALNCVANGKILKEKIFDKIWVQPAAGDAGGSLGAALALWYIEQNNPRKINIKDDMQGSYLGPEYSQNEIEEQLTKIGAKYEIISDQELIDKTANDLSQDNAIGWFQGRMEFGPRALGARSILANPKSDHMQKNLNLKVKYRESFRPFAPSVLKEDVSEWFNIDVDSPYMLMVSNINKDKTIEMTNDQKKLFGIDKLNVKRSVIPAVTHVDYSARIQTVHRETNSKYYDLIKRFKDKTNCPILINTSFNVRGEPIVNTVFDAFNCFMGTNLDKLVIGNCYLDKKNQNKSLKKEYKNKFELD